MSKHSGSRFVALRRRSPSSRRFKNEIRDLGDLSERLLELRVVSFRYRPEVIGSAESRLEFGLIAEEVAEVFQELVVYDEGQDRMGVGYHQLVPLLLDELQEQHREMQALKWLVGVMLLTGVAVTVRRWRFG